MIDIHDRVVACDFQKIILINASDHNNVHVDWVSYFPGGGSKKETPLSPTIVENRTIIVPTTGEHLYAFNVTNGHLLAAISFWDNSSNVSFYAVREMNWSDFFTILSNSLVCPYHYDSANHVVIWNSTIPYGIMPMDPVFFEGNIMFETDRSGVVAAIDMTNGSILAMNSLGTPELRTGGKQYATINSACVKGNRVYLTTQFPPPNLLGRYNGNISGRLYAIDVNSDPQNILKEAWNYSFIGQSQASPTLINDTIYFDGFNGNYSTLNGSNRNPRIYAVNTNGTLRWKTNYSNITGFSFSMDPRGGFWYNDMGEDLHGGGGRKLVHFSAENGTRLEEINVTTLLNDTQHVYPMSCMTICGTSTHPIMIVSANHRYFHEGKWVIAINLSDNNKLLWKVPIESPLNFNYASGQYTILNESGQYRVLFGTFSGGVMAIGKYPNCWFQHNTMNYQLKDSQIDINTIPDSIQINYTIHSSLAQDHIKVKAILSAEAQNGHPLYPLLYTNSSSKNYTITSTGITDSINVSLKKNAPFGKYKLTLFLFNSTGIVENQESIIGEELGESLGRYANDSYKVSDLLMGPLNDIPETPTIWSGPTGDLKVRTSYPFNVSTTDPNGDSVIYQ